jgi:hypothetical protein
MLSTRSLAVLLLVAACAPGATPAPAPDLAAERAAVDSVLSEFHQLASEGNWERYFALFAPDAVFFGTDATERWSVDEFRGYADGSSGWTYVKTERHVFVDPDGTTAWFDERLQNARYGETRGTGVLVRGEAGWKLTQYNLTIPIPNDLAVEFADRIKALQGGE